MVHKYLFSLSMLLLICVSCQKKPSLSQVNEVAVSFSKAYYNFNYMEAKEWATSSSLSYLSFLASNLQQSHLELLKAQGEADISVVSSQTNNELQEATVILLIENALIVNPISGETQQIAMQQDTLRLIKEENKWLVRKDIQLQNGM